jgi:dihydrofolate reductase
MKIKLIVAMCKNGGIGYRNEIPWKIKKDLLYFSCKTTGEYGKYMRNIKNSTTNTSANMDKSLKKNAIIMGKNTWLSLPKYPDPLKNRDNIILSTSIPESITCSSDSDLIIHFSSISRIMSFCISPGHVPIVENSRYEWLEKHEENEKCEINRNSIVKKNNSLYDEIWIIGGTQIYNIFVNGNMRKDNNDKDNNDKDNNILINEFAITYIDKYYECDTFFPRIENMNLYYISSFSRCENIDDNTGLYVPVYYIVFTLIDCDNSEHIRKKYVECVGDIGRGVYYYYMIKDDKCEYITNDNVELFMWCVTKC